MDEREAITRLQRGDIGGLAALVERYQTKAVRAAYLVCRNRATAEDVVQSAFIRVYERIAQFDPERPFAPWFMRIVVNDTLNLIQREARHQPLADETLAWSHPAVGEDPLTILARSEEIAVVAATLDQLPAQQRATLVQRYYLGMSESEMAQIGGVAPGTVKWRLHQARAKMRQLLPAWVGPNEE